MEGLCTCIEVDWVRMAQNVLRFNVLIVGKFFNKGSWVSEAWRKEHPEGLVEGPEGPPERIPSMEERREQLHLHHDGEGTVYAASGHATSTQRSVDACKRGNPNTECAGQSTYIIERFTRSYYITLHRRQSSSPG